VNLKKEGIIDQIGAGKGGYWKILIIYLDKMQDIFTIIITEMLAAFRKKVQFKRVLNKA